jgi:hypothetical protein
VLQKEHLSPEQIVLAQAVGNDKKSLMQNWRPAITTTDVAVEKPNPANAHLPKPAGCGQSRSTL